MNMPTHLHNARFALCLIGLLLSACTPTIPEQQRDPGGITSNSTPYEQPVYTTNTANQSLQGSQILSSYSGSYALLIGESQYTNGWSTLESIPGELAQVEDVLRKQGFKVEKSLNLNAEQLGNRFKTFINDYGFDEDNRLLFFYSGHGHTRKDKGYLVPTDAPNPHLDEKGFLQKALTMNDILAMARRMEAKHALFLFDSCFSGTVFKAKALPKMPRQISQMAELPVRQFITAGSADESVPAKSVFTPAFVDALRYGLGDLYQDGYVTGEELGLYLKNKVPEHTDQTPQYGKIRDYKLSRGDFVFALGSHHKQDTDRDSVTDDQDHCPHNTPAEIAKGVYKKGRQKGCPIDSDQDRVADYQDRCPYNRAEEIAEGVNSNGCPKDRDRDGVADYRDRCPRNTSKEISQGVDSRGCPLDSDRDSVADYQDACLGTSSGVKVKQNGCPVQHGAPIVSTPPSDAYYVVQLGDTLYKIAKHYGLSVAEIASWNSLQPPYNLSVGQILRVSPLSPVETVSSNSSYRYTDNGDGTVTDNRSGLIWLKNANCFGLQNWKTAKQSAANLAHGQCGLGDGSRAGMWRLPTKDELEAMIDEKYGDWRNNKPALSNAAGTGPWKEGDAFSGVQARYYWSSTPLATVAFRAWVVGFDSNGVSYDGKARTHYVWPLRGR